MNWIKLEDYKGDRKGLFIGKKDKHVWVVFYFEKFEKEIENDDYEEGIEYDEENQRYCFKEGWHSEEEQFDSCYDNCYTPREITHILKIEL